MRLARLTTPILLLASLILVASAAAQQIRFPDFSSLNQLDLNGPAHKATYNEQAVLRLTDGFRNAVHTQASTVWFDLKQPVRAGFTTYFAFQIHNPASCCTPGDGLAFVIQNSPGTDYCASGAGTTALGIPDGGMGYTGIRNSLAVEMDTRQDAWDPNNNHIAVQSCGAQANTSVHNPNQQYPICGGKFTVGSCLVGNAIDSGNDLPKLGVTCNGLSCQDGLVHQVVIEYTGSTQNNPGNLKIYVDPPFIPGTHTPANNAVPQINIPFTIENVIALDSEKAWVGFSASQASLSQAQDLLAWEFTPHEDVKITEVIQPGGVQTTFTYGGHVFGVTYPQGFQNQGGILMTVDAQLWNKATFYRQRLANTPFANEQCLTYLETGGNCIVYQVTCQDPITHQNVPCPSEPIPDIAIKTSYTTNDPVNAQNADFLKAPNDTNDWISIFTSFNQNLFDPTTSGSGKDFSDLVATFKPHGN
jgi:hypothetical protein